MIQFVSQMWLKLKLPADKRVTRDKQMDKGVQTHGNLRGNIYF